MAKCWVKLPYFSTGKLTFRATYPFNETEVLKRIYKDILNSLNPGLIHTQIPN